MRFVTRATLALLVLSLPLSAQVNAVCWPNTSDIKGAALYVCDLRAIPGTPLTGTHLMSVLADIEPIPSAFVVKKGEDANRGGFRRRFERFEKYALPIIAGLAAGDVFQVSTAWRVALATLPATVPNIREWVGAATPPDWEAPAQLIPTQDISFDSHGSAQVILYARKDAGVQRMTIPAEPVPAVPPASLTTQPATPGFVPSTYYRLYRDSQARSRDVIERWRGIDFNWTIEERRWEAEQHMNGAESEALDLILAVNR